MSIGYDVPACQAALRLYLMEVLAGLQKELLAEDESHMLTPEGRADLMAMPIAEVATLLTAEIVGGTWAVLDVFGTGSLMDQSNPALADYRSSDMWNPARQDLAIRSRPDTAGQRNIFGESVKGRGKGGRNLEDRYPPQPPSHAMQTAMRWMIPRMQEVLQAALNRFPWGQFIIATRD